MESANEARDLAQRSRKSIILAAIEAHAKLGRTALAIYEREYMGDGFFLEYDHYIWDEDLKEAFINAGFEVDISKYETRPGWPWARYSKPHVSSIIIRWH